MQMRILAGGTVAFVCILVLGMAFQSNVLSQAVSALNKEKRQFENGYKKMYFLG